MTERLRDSGSTTHQPWPNSFLWISAGIAGVAAIAAALYQVLDPGPPEVAYESAEDYFREAGFLVFLAASIAAVIGVAGAGISGWTGSLLVAAGYGLIAIGVAIGLAVREELDWFFVVAGPGLVLSTLGYIVFAISIWRRASLPRWAAVLCGVGGPLAILMAEFGTGVLIGSFWLFVAARVRSYSPR